MPETEKPEITQKSQLIDYFELGCKSPGEWSIGTEHEKFLFHKKTAARVGYFEENGIRTIFNHLQQNAWQPVAEKKNVVGLKKNGASITLEPGGQVELSGSKLRTLQETFLETQQHYYELEEICERLNLFSLSLGVDPLSARSNVPWIPKTRYRYMKEYMPQKGKLGHEMMQNTASVQVNLDFSSEQDMIKKIRIAQALQPVATAIFANSPFSQGKPNGFLSYRAHVWDDTDPDRCGFLPFVFDEGFGFEYWVDYLLDVPMYFIQRGENYHSPSGMTFRDFLQGKYTLKPTLEDWDTHVATVFPDIRLKQFIEMRGADAGSVPHVTAVSALWTGLLYDAESLEESYELISTWNINELKEMRSRVPKDGLNAASGNLHAGKIAKQICRIAENGLKRRSELLGIGDESHFLEPVRKITTTGVTPAEMLLQLHEKKLSAGLDVSGWEKYQLQMLTDKTNNNR
ncbi:glutamate--cysteine ligase [Tangfeifania diversioriginum]|uniref:Glutamate--cysteine ligase n=1 Tax=Tangfeifania diversioriginum TaxID=1168035 RepID=A0A1M6HG50_9BACT|nr:glutamate--cysteine ligase [Tangfeifania diversioriginum]SHJ21196.1 glutamate--cysteine ligase [Tangfeifania diversioriginum]